MIEQAHAPGRPTSGFPLLERLACPECRSTLGAEEGGLSCQGCGARYPVIQGIADLRPAATRDKPELGDWTRHWSGDNQALFSQRFFSFYRKAVFARTVAHFIDRHFPREGVFVEAGSGTSETSLRIDKAGNRRVLVATDIVFPVLAHCHPIMDVRVSADIFRLPFADDAIDGIWNVGVMEHFTHDLIDQILVEFRRVLKPGASLILLWPATDSLPQKGLRLVEKIINLRRRESRFQFHPDEISQLRSSREGRAVLTRNGFETTRIDWGLRSLMAFKTLVGRKPARASAES